MGERYLRRWPIVKTSVGQAGGGGRHQRRSAPWDILHDHRCRPRVRSELRANLVPDKQRTVNRAPRSASDATVLRPPRSAIAACVIDLPFVSTAESRDSGGSCNQSRSLNHGMKGSFGDTWWILIFLSLCRGLISEPTEILCLASSAPKFLPNSEYLR